MAPPPSPLVPFADPGHPLFDSHCHLESRTFGDDEGVDEAVLRARTAGVGRMLTIGSGFGVEAARRGVAVAERHDDVWAAIGVHPHDAREWDAASGDLLRSLAQHPRVVALGEMGLDFHYDNSPRDQQRAAFRDQLRLAAALRLPVIIHDRDSGDECLEILLDEGAFEGRGLVYHCYSGSVASMERIVQAGGHISIPGIITFKKADELRAVAAACPLDRLFIETDTPFLTPAPYRGRRNEPALVGYTAAAVAAARGVSVAQVAKATWENASAFFAIEGAKTTEPRA